VGLRRQRDGAQRAGAGRDVPPAEHGEALLDGDVLDGAHRGGPSAGVRGEERHAEGVLPHRRQVEVDGGADQAVGDLQQHAGPVARRLVDAGGAPVVEVLQGREALGDDVVAGDAAQPGHEGHAAGVVLEAGVVEALRGAGRHGRVVHGSSDSLCACAWAGDGRHAVGGPTPRRMAKTVTGRTAGRRGRSIPSAGACPDAGHGDGRRSAAVSAGGVRRAAVPGGRGGSWRRWRSGWCRPGPRRAVRTGPRSGGRRGRRRTTRRK